MDPRGKFKPNWAGPFLVKKILRNGAARLTDLEGNEFKEPINIDRLKKYFAQKKKEKKERERERKGSLGRKPVKGGVGKS